MHANESAANCCKCNFQLDFKVAKLGTNQFLRMWQNIKRFIRRGRNISETLQKYISALTVEQSTTGWPTAVGGCDAPARGWVTIRSQRRLMLPFRALDAPAGGRAKARSTRKPITAPAAARCSGCCRHGALGAPPAAASGCRAILRPGGTLRRAELSGERALGTAARTLGARPGAQVSRGGRTEGSAEKQRSGSKCRRSCMRARQRPMRASWVKVGHVCRYE